jgi:hypothetical protein
MIDNNQLDAPTFNTLITILYVYLGFVVPCIFKYSNKNTQPDATINLKIYCLVT